MNRINLALLLAFALALTTACSDDSGTKKKDGGTSPDIAVTDSGAATDTAVDKMLAGDTAPTGATKVQFTTTLGDFVVELNAAKAPKTVANFLAYVNAGFYDGTIFHRVISTFMIQGGGYTTAMVKKTTNPAIANEADNGLSNLTGTIAMARTSVPDSATSQFFINVVANTGLDHTSKTTAGWGYAVFGQVISGMDTVNKIKAVKTGPKAPFTKDVPVVDVVMNTVKVVK